MTKLDSHTIDRVVQRLVQEFSPEQIILYGSHAWGRPNMNSDVDLMVIVSDSDLPPTKRASQAYKALVGLKIPADIVVSTKAEIEPFKATPGALIYSILKRGKYLYERQS